MNKIRQFTLVAVLFFFIGFVTSIIRLNYLRKSFQDQMEHLYYLIDFHRQHKQTITTIMRDSNSNVRKLVSLLETRPSVVDDSIEKVLKVLIDELKFHEMIRAYYSEVEILMNTDSLYLNAYE